VKIETGEMQLVGSIFFEKSTHNARRGGDHSCKRSSVSTQEKMANNDHSTAKEKNATKTAQRAWAYGANEGGGEDQRHLRKRRAVRQKRKKQTRRGGDRLARCVLRRRVGGEISALVKERSRGDRR